MPRRIKPTRTPAFTQDQLMALAVPLRIGASQLATLSYLLFDNAHFGSYRQLGRARGVSGQAAHEQVRRLITRGLITISGDLEKPGYQARPGPTLRALSPQNTLK